MKSLLRIMRYVRPYRIEISVGILTVLLPVAMELVVPRMIQHVIGNGIRANNWDAIVAGVLVVVSAAFISAVAAIGQGFMRARLSQGMAFDVRNDLFNHIQSLPFETLDQLRTGGLMTRISNDVDTIRLFAVDSLALMLRALTMIIGSMVIVLLMNWRLAMIMVICLAIAAVIIWQFTLKASPLFLIVQRKLTALNTNIQENLAGTYLVKAFVREQYEIKHFETRNMEYMIHNIYAGRILALVVPILTILTNLGLVGVIWFGGNNVIGGQLTIGELVAFNSYLMIGMSPVLLLGNILTMASRAEASALRVLEVLDTQPELQPLTAFRSEQMQGLITFENVSFKYNTTAESDLFASDFDNVEMPDNDQRSIVLEHIHFEARPGQRIALLGVTGAGKTTLINLIGRFYDVSDGRILIDGMDVREWDIATLRSQIGIVLQQTILFSGTVRENIAYGKPEAVIEDVIAAAQAAQAHDFIMTMPEQYDSSIEARGANLSGGQKQRIALARALLVKPSILIMDDSTSAVDIETEVKIQEALNHYLANTTTFIIAQRITSVLDADQIMILDGGQIIATGNHQELLKTSTIYEEIYQSQFGTWSDERISTDV